MDVDERAAVGDQLTTGISFRSPTWGNGGLEVLQPHASDPIISRTQSTGSGGESGSQKKKMFAIA